MYCSICIDQITENKEIKCNCGTVVCTNCYESYINHCETQINTLPKCPNIKCSNEHEWDEIKYLNTPLLDKYAELVFNYISKNEDFTKIYNDQKLLKELKEKIQNEKNIYVKNKYDPCIAEIIKICYSQKIKKLNKENKDFIKKAIDDKNIKCFNLICKGKLGILNEYLICNLCDTKFCNECQKKYNENHECLKEDIESVNFVKSLVKCPKCKYAVIKSIGCDNITCSLCHTNFSYISGEKTTAGNHVKREKINIMSHNLFTELNDKTYSTSYIEKISLKKPSIIDIKTIITIYNKIIEEKQKSKILLLKSYLKYKKFIHQNKIYSILCNELIELHNDKKLTNEILEKYSEIEL